MTLTEARRILAHLREDAINGRKHSPEENPSIIEAIDTVCGTVEKPTFILLAHDKNGPTIVRRWLNDAAEDGCPPSKIDGARSTLLAINRYQRKNGIKRPD